ncbi:MAG: serine hydrolase domain-containing protein [Actinomycetota bacterium]
MPPDPAELCARVVADGVVGSVQAVWVDARGVEGSCAFGAADPDSRFALASLTKPIVAVACLVAAEEGGLDLEGPLVGAATAADLLAHSAGLPFDDAAARRVQLDPSAGWGEVAAAYAAVAPVAPARTRRTYSNVGYARIALALEEGTGMAWGAYARAAVLEPLGMAATTFGCPVDDTTVLEVREAGLLGHGEQLFNGPRFRTLGLPQSGAYGTAADYLRLVRLVLRDGVGEDGSRLLAPETCALLRTNHAGALPGGVGQFMEWDRCDWALGFELRDGKVPHWTGAALSEQAFTHFGAAGTLAFGDPATGAAGVVLADRGTYSGWMLGPGGWPDICAAIAA